MAKVQIGISVESAVHDEIQRMAEKVGMTRPQFMVRLAVEAIQADLAGRPLFQPSQAPQTPTVDPGLLVAMTGELTKLVSRLKGVLRAHDQRDAELIGLASTNAEAISEAQEQLATRIRDWLESGIDPYTEKMDALAETVTQQGATWAKMIQNHCDAMASMMLDHHGFRSIATELRQQRELIEKGWPDLSFHIGANWRFSGLSLLGWLAGGFATSLFALVFWARTLPDDWVAVPVTKWLFSSEAHAACAVGGNRYTANGRCINPAEYRS